MHNIHVYMYMHNACPCSMCCQVLRRGANVNDRDAVTDLSLLHYACKSGAAGVGNVAAAVNLVTSLLNKVPCVGVGVGVGGWVGGWVCVGGGVWVWVWVFTRGQRGQCVCHCEPCDLPAYKVLCVCVWGGGGGGVCGCKEREREAGRKRGEGGR